MLSEGPINDKYNDVYSNISYNDNDQNRKNTSLIVDLNSDKNIFSQFNSFLALLEEHGLAEELAKPGTSRMIN